MKTVIHMIITLTVIGIVSGGLLSQISNWASPKIAKHREEETKQAIFKVQPKAGDYRRIEIKNLECYKVLDSSSQPLGYALVHEGNGFQGKIRLMVGLMPNLGEISGLEILEQVETPGLGTKVTESPFTNQFSGLQTTPEIKWVKGAPPSQPNEIQAITGATISSKSVVFILNDGIKKLREFEIAGGGL